MNSVFVLVVIAYLTNGVSVSQVAKFSDMSACEAIKQEMIVMTNDKLFAPRIIAKCVEEK